MGMGSECCPCRASGSAGGGAEEKQGGDGADNGGETLEDKKIYSVNLFVSILLGCKLKFLLMSNLICA